jgi:hypothetical protein
VLTELVPAAATQTMPGGGAVFMTLKLRRLSSRCSCPLVRSMRISQGCRFMYRPLGVTDRQLRCQTSRLAATRGAGASSAVP